jgi:hypothetical protein
MSLIFRFSRMATPSPAARPTGRYMTASRSVFVNAWRSVGSLARAA